MINFQQFNLKFYLSGAIVIGFLQIIDGVAGLLGISSDIARAFSLFEIVWLIFSLFFFFAFKAQHATLYIPILYIGYSVYGGVVGAYLNSITLPNAVFILPVWYIISAILFGCVYCFASLLTYRHWYLVKGGEK